MEDGIKKHGYSLIDCDKMSKDKRNNILVKRGVYLPDKPKEPVKTRIGLSTYIFCLIAFIFFSIIYSAIWSILNKNTIYNTRVAEYKEIEEQQHAAIEKAKQEVRRYIHNIDNNYDIDIDGNISVIVSVKTERDSQAQYIGEELSYDYFVNNKPVYRQLELRINLFHEMDFYTKIVEDDPASDDVGEKKTSQPISFLEINDGIQIYHTVKVRESYGKDAGHVDIYNVTYSIKPKQILGLSASQRELFPNYPIIPNEPKKTDYSMSIWETINHYSEVKIGIVIILCLSVIGLVRHIYKIKKKYNKELREYHERNQEYNTEKEEFIRSMEGKTIRELAGVPSNVQFTDEGLPYTIDNYKKYGRFTLYVTKSGNCYHKAKDCSNSKSIIPVHMYSLPQYYIPCSKCAKNYDIKSPKWYLKYQEYKAKCEYYEIEY